MAEYFEREALIGDLTAAMDHRGMGQVIGQTLIRYVKRQPAADVAPVVHGRWEKTGKQNDTWTCSACGSRVGAFLAGCSAYCYHCGAKMGGGAT